MAIVTIMPLEIVKAKFTFHHLCTGFAKVLTLGAFMRFANVWVGLLSAITFRAIKIVTKESVVLGNHIKMFIAII